MKWLSAGLTFVNFATIAGLILGMACGGLNQATASLSFTLGAAAAILAYLRTSDPKPESDVLDSATATAKLSKRAQRRLQRADALPASLPFFSKYRNFWAWFLAACFLMFAVRSFCWLLYIDSEELRIQSPNNLGDLALHIAHIRYFANGVPLWPANPIYVISKHLRYPAGTDLFNALLCLNGVDLTSSLVWTGLVASIATFYAFYRWGGAFGVAGFLFNGGIAGFQILSSSPFFHFADYQGDKSIAWKSIPLAMFVTQRGLLYAIPAGLLLLWHWREKLFRAPAQHRARGPLPFWVELALYASMPLFHLHTFLALTIVLVFLFIFSDPQVRGYLIIFVGAAFIPATFLTWLITDHFHAGSVLEWHPGWVQDSEDFAAPFFRIGPLNFGAAIPLLGWVLQKTWNGIVAPFFQFWLTNFGILIPLLLGWMGLAASSMWEARTRWGEKLLRSWRAAWRAWKTEVRWPQKFLAAWNAQRTGIRGRETLSEEKAFLLPAVAIFLLGFFVKTAPWEWDNLKIMVWSYFLMLPFLWTQLIARWSMPARVAVCMALFASGFVSLLGGLAAGRPGFEFANRAELDGVGVAVRKLPAEARFAAYPTYNHPLLLQGRKVVLGYPGHLWTQGFKYDQTYQQLTELMQGSGNWRKLARHLQVRYIFWGREELINYPTSERPWEKAAALVASGSWGAIYDVGRSNQMRREH